MAVTRSAARLEGLMAVMATLAYVVLTIEFAQEAPALWRDEANSINTQAGSLADMWRASEFDSFPLLWMLLLRGWMAIGGVSDEWLRVFGCLCALALPAALWFAARRLGQTTPLVALALVSVNPHVIRWGASLRAWGLGLALAIVALVFLKDAAQTPTRRRVLMGAGAAILSVQCVYQNAVLLGAAIAGCVVMLAWERRWRNVIVPIAIGTVAALSLTPYWALMARRAEWNLIAEAPVTLGYLARQFLGVLAASGAFVACGWAALVLGAAASLAIRVRPHVLFLAVTVAVSIGGMLIFYRAFGYPTQPWYYLGIAVVAGAGCELVVASLQSAVTPMFRAVLAAGVLIVGAPVAWSELQEPLTNMHLAGARLTTDAAPDDIIVLYPWEWGVSLTRYYSGRAAVLTVPPLANVTVHRYDLLKTAMVRADPIGSLLSRIQSTLQAGHRVWYVGTLPAGPAGASARIPGPPPLSETGWRAAPYVQAWANATGAFIRDHSIAQRVVPLASRGGRLEDVAIVVVSGWK